MQIHFYSGVPRFRSLFFALLCILAGSSLYAQDNAADSTAKARPKVKPALFDGSVIVGYVDKGAFLNFTGPNINMSIGRSRIVLGMLPSLRFKKDHSPVRNSLVTPNLGAGITYSYGRIIAIQIPVYYNTKTATSNGRWEVGIGLGVRLK
ncbi:MAG: hypothetical protein IBJ09_09540 [Bacteroidia bacterium]|nr:hypothetical protein [Bacteroidia bacterium]